MGLNVQCCCDHLCRFTFVHVAAPGGSHDLQAYSRGKLSKIVEKLPTGYYVIGDNAYVPSEHLITPFSGNQRDVPANGIYNYYCSQIRIRIEMAYGLLNTKWRVFRSPLQMSLQNSSKVIYVGAILHNYVINCSNPSIRDEVDPMYLQNGGLIGYIPSTVTVTKERNDSIIRDYIVQSIVDRNITRPTHNLVRNCSSEIAM